MMSVVKVHRRAISWKEKQKVTAVSLPRSLNITLEYAYNNKLSDTSRTLKSIKATIFVSLCSFLVE